MRKRKTFTIMISLVTALSLSGCTLLQSGIKMMDLAGQKKGGQDDIMILTETACESYIPTDGLAAYCSPEYNVPDWNTEEYRYYQGNGWCNTMVSPFSTFGADTDTASYANVRRMVLNGQAIVPDAIRAEEWINYFHYDYPAAAAGDSFSVTTEIAPCPWNGETQLMLIGLKARETDAQERAASNLVFLIDVSGSMDEYNKLPLVQRAFRLLADQLDENDRISIVTYANNDAVVLEGVSGDQKSIICDVVEGLQAAGGTNGSDGINTAYRIAEENYIEGGNNRIILATDGDLNIGITDEGSLTRLIKEKAETGVFLSVLGFGYGNISDTNMQALADNGNGNYHYIDSISEARRVLIDEAGGTLFTVAKDVKLQVEFNPAKVKGYRLIGYEKREMAAEDFTDDTKDGGEIGSGHSVTVLYEIASADSAYEVPSVVSKYGKHQDKINTEDAAELETDAQKAIRTAGDDYENEWATLHIRYKEPDEDESRLLDTVIDNSAVMDEMSENLSWAAGVAQAAMVLKGSEYAGSTDLKEVRERLRVITDGDDFREEFVYLLSRVDLKD